MEHIEEAKDVVLLASLFWVFWDMIDRFASLFVDIIDRSSDDVIANDTLGVRAG